MHGGPAGADSDTGGIARGLSDLALMRGDSQGAVRAAVVAYRGGEGERRVFCGGCGEVA